MAANLRINGFQISLVALLAIVAVWYFILRPRGILTPGG